MGLIAVLAVSLKNRHRISVAIELMEAFMSRIGQFMLGLFVLCSVQGCPEPSRCEVEAKKACEETAFTIQYFNGLAGGERYRMDDCLKLISVQCPPGSP